MLDKHVTRYVQDQRAIGFSYRVQECLLRSFARFAHDKGDKIIHSQTAIEWASQAPSRAQRRNRLLTVRRFAIFMRVEDCQHAVPAADTFGRQPFPRRRPYIFTPSALNRLLSAAAQLTPKGSIRPLTYVTLFGLLATTGLRISEALRLNLDDITEDGLLVRVSKFRKNRLVPIHETTRAALQRYTARCESCANAQRAVFISLHGTALAYSTANATFLEVVRSIDLHPGPGSVGPRLHDLRHTFAVRSLEQCIGDANDVRHHMAALSTYLGHTHVSDTYWYLNATPRLMAQIAVAGETLHTGA